MVLAVIGVGLVGGSVAIAARERLGATVRAYDGVEGVVALAAQRGAVDVACSSIEEALEGAEIAVVATPVGALCQTLLAVLAAASPDCAVTDVGSTKRLVVEAISDPRFIGGHPLAGAETAGVQNARGDLFDDATWYLTPTSKTDGMLFERVHRMIVALGARPASIEAANHDRVMADVSHLPHILANVLVGQAAASLADDGQPIPATGPSFRAATRVAGANSAIWTDIYLSNAEALVEEVDGVIARLQTTRDALASRDGAQLTAWNDRAAADRRRLLEVRTPAGAVQELRVAVPNRAGVVAEVALALGRAGIDIVDMALYPSTDMRDGVIALWIAGEAPTQEAARLMVELGFPASPA
ncbi:MAG: prephenate dehydrogenase/arogenate dehydrogenase family protein [Actinomycetota bacterium]